MFTVNRAERPLQNRSDTTAPGSVKAARFLGGQPFVPPKIQPSHYLRKLGLATHTAKLVSYCVAWPPPERKAPETHVEISTALIPGSPRGSCCARWAQSPGAPQGPGRAVAPVQTIPTAGFRATNYEVRASLDAIGQVMNAQAKVDFAAREAGRVVDVELNQNLRVNSVRDVSGKPVTYDRDDNAGMKLHVTLADTIPAGGKVTLLFDYGGPLSSRMNEPRSRHAHGLLRARTAGTCCFPRAGSR